LQPVELCLVLQGCTHALARPELKEAVKTVVERDQAPSEMAQGQKVLRQQLLQALKLLEVLPIVQGQALQVL
jgi:hypothetical protein